jgi:hypothetical protein
LGSGKLAWWGLLGLSVIRLPLYLILPRRKKAVDVESAARMWERWDESVSRVAQRLRDDVEAGILERGPNVLTEGLSETAKRLHATVEIGIFERGLETLVAGLAKTTKKIHRGVEEQSLEGLLRRIVRMTLRAARQLQTWHTGRLRANLWWVVLCLVLAIGLVLAY